jgi:hypothetical protein
MQLGVSYHESFVLHILGALLVTAALQKPASLGAELRVRNLPVPRDAADLDRPITSYSVLDDSRGFVIAYYEENGISLRELHVRSYDKRTRLWRSNTFPEPIGSVLDVRRGAGHLYIAGHSSPSAAPLLVLSDALELKRELDGWPMLVLDDGRVVFQRSMVHFAPAHGGALALYDPAADREDSLYPPQGVKNERGIEEELVSGIRLLVDRSFDGVKKGKAPGTIEFLALEQRMRPNDRNGGDPAGPERRLRVVCNVAAARPVCTAQQVRQPGDALSGKSLERFAIACSAGLQACSRADLKVCATWKWKTLY